MSGSRKRPRPSRYCATRRSGRGTIVSATPGWTECRSTISAMPRLSWTCSAICLATCSAAGIDEGRSIRLTGEGEAGEPGAPPGDLYCQVRIRPHQLFVRNNQDLHCEVPITFSQAALGGTLEVPTLDSKFTNATLQRGTQN